MKPTVRIALETCRSAGTATRWQVAWRVDNEGNEPLRIYDVWVPHGRFRGVKGHTPINVTVEPGESGRLELDIDAAEEPGTIVENAFLILRTEHWRIFARMRIEFGDDGAPRPLVMRVTAQSIQ